MADAYNGAMYYDPNTGGVQTYMDGSNGVQGWVPVSNANQAADPLSVIGTPTVSQPVYQDPFAKWGGKSAYDTLRSGFDSQKQNIYGSSNDAAAALQGGLGQSVQDTIHSLTLGQQGIDRKNVQNESSRIQGTRGIMDMVGRGIRSGGVMLANKNAGNSSAAGALANAYGQQGQRQLSQVGNQYAANQGDIGVAQAEQDYQVGQAPGKFHEGLMQNVNSIVNSARDKFAQLDAAMANASLPDRIAIEQEKESVRGQVLGMLQQYDTQLQQGVGGIKAADRGTNLATANQQISAGQADPNLFKYNTQAPGQFQGTGPFASELPIFTMSRGKRIA
jgi:hypothetical protein